MGRVSALFIVWLIEQLLYSLPNAELVSLHLDIYSIINLLIVFATGLYVSVSGHTVLIRSVKSVTHFPVLYFVRLFLSYVPYFNK
jgi:hypothetical protein